MNDLLKKYRRTKLACYFAGFSMAAATNLSPLLFITFNSFYGISFTALGFLVLVNFCTQLFIDLVFTFFSDNFNLTKTIKSIPLIVFFGMIFYSVVPVILPEYTYAALVVGTFIFSLGAGLGEVLTSPVIAAIPSDNPEKEMSKLHSAYAWGTVVVVILSTLFVRFIGNEKWIILALLWSIVPLFGFFLFAKAEIPALDLSSDGENKKSKIDIGIALCTLCIFFGGAAECTMTQWVSGFAEKALGVSKVYGDVFGMALFAFALGMGRTLFSNKGKSIYRVLLLGMASAFICYIVAALSPNNYIGLIACALTGFCTSMLWPGTIVYTNEKYISCSVGIYALLAAGGDLGASLSPQLLGIIADKVAASGLAKELSLSLMLTPEQIGMKAGMLIASLFPAVGFVIVFFTERYFRKQRKNRI